MAALAGRQVTDVEELYSRICGESRPEDMPREIRRGLRQLLKLLGYEERWVLSRETLRSGFKWVRDPWPIDAVVLRGREVETFTNFD